jgi:hypothetical protein
MPTQADLENAEAEFNAAARNYREKLAHLHALASEVLAASPQDVPPLGGGPNEAPFNPNDPEKGSG